MKKRLLELLRAHPLFSDFDLTGEHAARMITELEEEYQAWFLSVIVGETEEIMTIDPRLPLRDILQQAADRIVSDLGADASTIRLFDPETLRMISFGAAGVADSRRLAAVPVKDSISGMVFRERRSIAVSNLLEDPLYKSKQIVKARGFNSLLAVPLFTPSYIDAPDNLLGSLQIYYRQQDRRFSKLEMIKAEVLARRISFVLAKKKILNLQALNQRKEMIVNKIFVKLSMREGIKLRDLFNLLMPELEQILPVRSCSLFTVSDDQQFIRLEAAFPLDQTYHETGYTFTISHHPYFRAAVKGDEPPGDRRDERITNSYLLIKDPGRSRLISSKMREFAEKNHIHSILLVPLLVGERVRHLLAFYATEQKQYFTDEEIELFTFFGKEVMKASRLEFLGDVLHDLKNPAVAVAGFANRARKLMAGGDLESVREKLSGYLEIMAEEADRLQDLTLALTGEGREEVLDLAEVVGRRHRINKAAVAENRLQRVECPSPELTPGLRVFCTRYSLERVVDNLLHNATKAVPEQGGKVGVRVYREEKMACLEVANTGEIPADNLEELRKGKSKGRGFGIIQRFVTANHGKLEIDSGNNRTVVTVKLPLAARP